MLFAVSCSESNDDGGGNDEPIKLSPGTELKQEAFADEEQALAPIKFTATAPWKATVAEIQTKAEAGRVDWLELSKYEGEKGEVSINMKLYVNTTGQDRKAEIRIECAGTSISITVEQKGKTESGGVPEDPDKPKPEPIELTGETPTQQSVWADETQTPKNIAFKALASWTATVAEVGGKAEAGRVDWLALSAYEGGAGENSLTITLKPNLTGQDRKAEIRIACGDKTIVLTVEQKGTKADGTLPEDPNKPEQSDLKNRIKRIETYWYNEAGKLEPLDEYFEFEYDETGRVTHVKWFEYGDGGYSDVEVNAAITYGDKTVAYKSEHKEGSDISISTGSIELDEKGRAVSGKADEDIHNSIAEWSYIYNLTYNAEGYLVKTDVTEKEGNRTHKSLYTITWTNGNPTQAIWENGDKPVTDQATYSTIENKTNIDLNWMLLLDTEAWNFVSGDPTNAFSMMGYMGKRPQNMVKSVTDGYDHDACSYDYQLDNEGRIAKIIEYNDHYSIEYRIFYAE